MMDISKKTIFISIILILIFSTALVSAESIWEGSAAMGRYGEFPFTGFYGASNSFQQNDFVEVENLENGKRTRLIVVDRLSDPGLLMLVSNEAAQELGIYQNDIARIKVRKLSSGQTPKSLEHDDLAYNPDPDLNPAAALTAPEEMEYRDIADSRVTEPPAVTEPEAVIADAEPEPEPEAVEPEAEPPLVVEPEATEPEVAEVETVEAEPEIAAIEPDEGPLWEDAEAEGRGESEFPVLSELPPSTDGLKDAEVLISEEEIPADIAADTPEKPYEWPDSVEVTEPESEPEPLYLTMDDLDEGSPMDEAGEAAGIAHAADTEVLWPDGEKPEEKIVEAPEEILLTDNGLDNADPLSSNPDLSGRGVEFPESRLELLSSGLAETNPAYTAADNFSVSILPDVTEKASEDDAEYLTDTSDYYSPAERSADIALTGLPAPEPEVPEEVIAVLVGDDILIAEAEPEAVEVDSGYAVSPELRLVDESVLSVVSSDLKEAKPLMSDDSSMIAEMLPALPGKEDMTLVEVANGYISPEEPDFTGDVADYPNLADATGAPEVTMIDDEVDYAEAPDTIDESAVPSTTELPELTESDEAGTEDIETAVPEYDENLEVTLVPAEVRPPELVDDENALAESEPEAVEPLNADIAEHSPEPDEADVTVDIDIEIESEPAEIAAVPETVPPVVVQPDLTAPAEVMMVSKLVQQKHYLQLGAFKEKNSAIKAAGSLAETYPVTILTDDAASGVSYKLLLGPLSADESGVMLYTFRAGGYSDAFIRRIE